MKRFATGPFLDQPRDYHASMQEALDHAEYMAEEYLIPYAAWSTFSYEPTERGDHRDVVSVYPKQQKRRNNGTSQVPNRAS